MIYDAADTERIVDSVDATGCATVRIGDRVDTMKVVVHVSPSVLRRLSIPRERWSVIRRDFIRDEVEYLLARGVP